MNANQSLNTQDILDSIDINMINMNDKKKRGRPKKNNNIINTNLTKIKLDNPSNNNEQEEFTYHSVHLSSWLFHFCTLSILKTALVRLLLRIHQFSYVCLGLFLKSARSTARLSQSYQS